MMQLADGNHKSRRRNTKIKITIKQQQQDGEQDHKEETVFQTAMEMDRPRMNKKNVEAQSNMFAQLIQELHAKQMHQIKDK